MSISTSIPVYIVPIFREPGLPVKEPGILARWHGTTSVTGDLSAGVMTVSFYFPDYGALLGGKVLWDLRAIGGEYQFAGAPSDALLSINSNERSNSGGLQFKRTIPFASSPVANIYNMEAYATIIHEIKMGISNVVGSPSTMQLSVTNVNTAFLVFSASGYIYDERMI